MLGLSNIYDIHRYWKMSHEHFQKLPLLRGTLDRLVQPAILAVLAQGPSHGYQIARGNRQNAQFRGRKTRHVGIYRFLKSMEAKGLVVSSWDTPASGHAKRLFEITEDGQVCLAQWVETLGQYLTTINSLLKTAKMAVASQKRKSSRRLPK